jgi:hypothetical protein
MALQAKHVFAPDDVDRIEVIAPRAPGGPPSTASDKSPYARLCMGYAVAKVPAAWTSGPRRLPRRRIGAILLRMPCPHGSRPKAMITRIPTQWRLRRWWCI